MASSPLDYENGKVLASPKSWTVFKGTETHGVPLLPKRELFGNKKIKVGRTTASVKNNRQVVPRRERRGIRRGEIRNGFV